MKALIVLLFAATLTSKGLAQTQTNLTDAQVNKVVNAIYIVEGGPKTKYPYGIKSIKTSDPRRVCFNTVRNNYARWIKAGAKGDYLDYLANVYCPAKDDPKGNANWKKNIHKLIDKL